MKIVFLVRALDIGGAETQLTALATGLKAAGHTVAVAVFYAGGPLEASLRRAGIAVLALDKHGRWDLIGFARRLIRALRKAQPDVVHGYLVGPNVLSVLAKPFLPGARIVWGVRASNMELQRYDWLARAMFRLSCRLARFADLIITNSVAGRDYHVTCGFPTEKIRVIANGIDIDRFRPDPGARRRQRTAWGVADEDKLIGLVARLDPMKDHATFLRAARMLLDGRTDVRFVCVGDGPQAYRSELQAQAADLGLGGRVVWDAGGADVAAVYNALDVLSSSSAFGEGFSNAIAEAMACGTPCVATDVGDAARIVGDLGVLVSPRDPQALAAGWQTMLGRIVREGAALGQRARGRIEAEFSSARLVRDTEDVLRRVAGVQ